MASASAASVAVQYPRQSTPSQLSLSTTQRCKIILVTCGVSLLLDAVVWWLPVPRWEELIDGDAHAATLYSCLSRYIPIFLILVLY